LQLVLLSSLLGAEDDRDGIGTGWCQAVGRLSRREAEQPSCPAAKLPALSLSDIGIPQQDV